MTGTWVYVNVTDKRDAAADAVRRSIAEKNEKLKEEQIAKNKSIADKLNTKV